MSVKVPEPDFWSTNVVFVPPLAKDPLKMEASDPFTERVPVDGFVAEEL